ncbi:MAG: thiol:disulfide interchange protein TlpA [Beijerinckiaceae bacterium]
MMISRFRSLAAAVLALGLYGMMLAPGNAQGGSCAAAKSVADRIRPLVKGEIAGVLVGEKQQALPNLAFQSPDGKPMTLADLKGRMVLLNLWATWCAPCRKEMPALDKLQAELGGPDFEVVAVNIDQRNLERPKAFLAEVGVSKLAYYADPSAKIFQQLRAVDRAVGMPTTLLIDKDGCELAYLAGPAEWASEEAKAFIRAALGR